MRGTHTVAFIAAATLVAPRAEALDHVEGDASLGFAFPAGSLERGSRVGDTTVGAIPLEIDGAFFYTPRLALRGALSLALTIPKLCASAGDCKASLGHDYALDVGARIALPAVGPVSPRLDAGIGWEWYGTTLSDAGVSSTRSYSGPTFAVLAVSAPFRFGSRFALGPSLAIRAGAFTSASRTTPAWTDSSLDGIAIHAWLRAAVDARVTF
jgi:hypothetical protein